MNKNACFFLFIFLSLFRATYCTDCDEYKCYNLVSYPRSANTWVRYCIEYLFKCPTIGPGGGSFSGDIPYNDQEKLLKTIDRPFNQPLDKYLNLDVDYNNPYFLKLHLLESIKNLSGPLILIVRNYKECIPSHIQRIKKDPLTFSEIINRISTTESYYFRNLQIYDRYRGKKILIYYEDLIKDPANTLKQISKFINKEPLNLMDFINNLPLHKNIVIEYYQTIGKFESITRGDVELYFSSKLSKQQNVEIDKLVESKYPYITRKYLSRYKEL